MKVEASLLLSILLLSIGSICGLSACQELAPDVAVTEDTRLDRMIDLAEPMNTLSPRSTAEMATPLTFSSRKKSSQFATMARSPSWTSTPTLNSDATMAAIVRSSLTIFAGPSPTPIETPKPADILDLAPASEDLVGSPETHRIGVTGEINVASKALASGLPFGAVLNYSVNPESIESDFELWQVVRTGEEGIRETTWEEIELAIQAHSGSYWVVGNEPDVRWQDNVTPERYAEIYHEVYTFIKERDPEARLVIAGVTQPTPIRRAYLDIVLEAYRDKYGQEMPIDIWNVHSFILREEQDSWGVDIPPGMDDALAINYDIEDHDDLAIMAQNLIDFRSWMAERGYGDKPLVVTEYGILMPEDYGFPPEKVADFLKGSFRLFQTLSGVSGYQHDGGRLVQQWFWFSVHDDYHYPTGNLFDPFSGQLTALGEVWKELVADLSIDAYSSP